MILVEMTYMMTLVMPTAKFHQMLQFKKKKNRMIDRSRGGWTMAKFHQFPFTFSISQYKYVDFNAAEIEISILDNYNVELK